MDHQPVSQESPKKQEQDTVPLESASPSISFALASANAIAAQSKPSLAASLQMPVLQMQRQFGNQATLRLLRTSTASRTHIQRSPLSDELSALWRGSDEHGDFFDRLRALSAEERSDQDLKAFIRSSLHGDDQWLALNLTLYGVEANWPPHLRIERELRGWEGTGDRDAIFEILRDVNGALSGDLELCDRILSRFPEHTHDRWLAEHLLRYGPEENFPLQDQVMNILYREDNGLYIRMILDNNYQVELFDVAMEEFMHAGEIYEVAAPDRHRGAFLERENTIVIRAGLSGAETATTLVHELEHTRVDIPDSGLEELEVRLRVENFRSRHGMPAENSHFRNPDGTPNQRGMVNVLARQNEYASLRRHADYDPDYVLSSDTPVDPTSRSTEEFPPIRTGNTRFTNRRPLTGWTLL